MATMPEGALRCQICSRTFKRSGHLRRHERSHLAQKPHRCPLCPCTFARRDTLQRHYGSHRNSPNLLQLGVRACINCAAAKTRCSGERHCKRCRDRETACEYPSPNQAVPHTDLATSIVPASNVTDDLRAQPFDTTAPFVEGPTRAEGRPLMSPEKSFTPVDRPSLLPDAMQEFTAPSLAELQTDIWSQDDLFAVNWLEEPIGPDSNFSPLTWDFPFVGQQRPPSASHSRDGGPVEREHSMTHLSSATPSVAQDSPNLHEGSANASSIDGEFYVDGNSARLPRIRKRTRSVLSERSWINLSKTPYSLHLAPNAVSVHAQDIEMSDDNYHHVTRLYQRLCRGNDAPWSAFADHQLPDKSVFQTLISLYWNRFNDLLPFQHWKDFVRPDRHHLLDLAMASIGSHYINHAIFTASMHELTRRCLILVDEESRGQLGHAIPFGNRTGAVSPDDQFSLTAATLLNVIGSTFCGDEQLHRHASTAKIQLKSQFENLQNRIGTALSSFEEQESATLRWQSVMHEERRIRLTFSIWLVDAMLAFHEATTPMLDIQSLQVTLPCADNVWRAKTVADWEISFERQLPRVKLVDALQELYYHKHFSPEHSEFVVILTIHGLFHRLWEVERYYSNPLSYWEPSSSRQSGEAPFPKQPVWLPENPDFRKWQNSACDALDVLHWQANSTIGSNRGLEHPVVLHLHLARIALLTPYRDIVAVARTMVSSAAQSRRSESNQALKAVRRWALYHQYKARLSAIHAGVTFWHVRRHGIDAFHEPSAIGLATLTLWAFSSFAERASSQSPQREQTLSGDAASSTPAMAAGSEEHEGDSPKRDSSNEADGAIILLDRPTDDELVQNFIRFGGTMKPHMSGVGEVWGSQAPQLILRQGIRLLSTQECWGASANWTNLLTRLRNVIHR